MRNAKLGPAHGPAAVLGLLLWAACANAPSHPAFSSFQATRCSSLAKPCGEEDDAATKPLTAAALLSAVGLAAHASMLTCLSGEPPCTSLRPMHMLGSTLPPALLACIPAKP